MTKFLERATQLEEPKDLPTALTQLKVLKAIIGHLEGQLQDALGVRAALEHPALDRMEARKMLNLAYAAQRAFGELNHAAQVLGQTPGAPCPFPEALRLSNERLVETDRAFMDKFFPVPAGAIRDLE